MVVDKLRDVEFVAQLLDEVGLVAVLCWMNIKAVPCRAVPCCAMAGVAVPVPASMDGACAMPWFP